jgi:hypothetical protein
MVELIDLASAVVMVMFCLWVLFLMKPKKKSINWEEDDDFLIYVANKFWRERR